MKIYVLIALLTVAAAAETKEESSTQATPELGKDKRQTQGEVVIGTPAHLVYRSPRRQKEQVAPVEEPQEDDKQASSNRAVFADEYRPGQVISLNAQELLELEPQRKAPAPSGQHLQQLYSNDVIPEHKQNLQQFYILEPQVGRQVAAYQPSHAVIARPSHSSNGGEASVGAALSVSDSGASDAFDQELLALLGHAPSREEPRVQAYTAVPQAQNNAPQYSQVERYITKPSKKPTKVRSKPQIVPTPLPTAPQQYLIETTNVQQQPQQYQPQLRTLQQARPVQSLRYVSLPAVQPSYYPVPESENQGIKIVAPPKLQQYQQPQLQQPQQHQPRGQLAYRLVPQYQQPEASPKQYRVIDPRPQPVRAELPRIPASSIDRPITYIQRYPDIEKMRSIKLSQQTAAQESVVPQSAQIVGDHYYIRPIYRATDQRGRYQLAQLAVGSMDQTRNLEPTKSPQSSIYVSQKLGPKKASLPLVRVDQPVKEQLRAEQPLREQQVDITNQSLEEQRSHLPPPRNHKAYTPEEFAALVAAGYSVTPVPVSSVRKGPHVQYAQSRSSIEPSNAPSYRRSLYSRRHQYLPLSGDDAP